MLLPRLGRPAGTGSGSVPGQRTNGLRREAAAGIQQRGRRARGQQRTRAGGAVVRSREGGSGPWPGGWNTEFLGAGASWQACWTRCTTTTHARSSAQTHQTFARRCSCLALRLPPPSLSRASCRAISAAAGGLAAMSSTWASPRACSRAVRSSSLGAMPGSTHSLASWDRRGRRRRRMKLSWPGGQCQLPAASRLLDGRARPAGGGAGCGCVDRTGAAVD